MQCIERFEYLAARLSLAKEHRSRLSVLRTEVLEHVYTNVSNFSTGQANAYVGTCGGLNHGRVPALPAASLPPCRRVAGSLSPIPRALRFLCRHIPKLCDTALSANLVLISVGHCEFAALNFQFASPRISSCSIPYEADLSRIDCAEYTAWLIISTQATAETHTEAASSRAEAMARQTRMAATSSRRTRMAEERDTVAR